jgi:hypothetical protein
MFGYAWYFELRLGLVEEKDACRRVDRVNVSICGVSFVRGYRFCGEGSWEAEHHANGFCVSVRDNV